MTRIRLSCRWFLRRWVSGTVGLAALLVGVASGASAGESEHWPNFRGPSLTGATEGANLPAEWGETDGIVWTTPLPGPSAATPAIWGDRVFVTAADAATGELLAMCLNAVDGKSLWRHAHGQNRSRGRSDMTGPSPVTDGDRVVFLFGTGRLVAYDFEGRQLWRRDLAEEFGTLSVSFGYAASPLLHEGRLYIQMMRRSTHKDASPDEPLESFLLAVDPASGTDLWRRARPAKAVDESWESYVTPVTHGEGREAQIVVAGADAVTGHDAANGHELWRCTFNERRRRNWRLVPTPVSDGERVYLALPRGVSLLAIEPGGSAEPIEDRTVWSMKRDAPDVCSPLLYRGRLYALDGVKRVLTCLDPATGRQIWQGKLGGKAVIRSSPTAADGKIYFIDETGLVFVVAAGDEFQVLSRIEMSGGRPARSSIAIAGNRLYVRTAEALHCIGATEAVTEP